VDQTVSDAGESGPDACAGGRSQSLSVTTRPYWVISPLPQGLCGVFRAPYPT
jgi:hypothetical protein